MCRLAYAILLLHTLFSQGAALLRCYSCDWTRNDAGRMFDCMNGLDLEMVSDKELRAEHSPYISSSSCIQCTKTELYKAGKLMSMTRSCTLHQEQLDTDLLPVAGCTEQQLRGAKIKACVCEDNLCNSAFSLFSGSLVFHHKLLLLSTLALLYSLHRYLC